MSFLVQQILGVLGRFTGSHRPDFSLFAIWALGHKKLASIYLLMYNLHCINYGNEDAICGVSAVL